MSQDNLLVRTETSSYLIHRSTDKPYVIRNPNESDLHALKNEVAVSVLRKDGEQIPLLNMSEPKVGERLRLTLDIRGDGVVTFRETTFVQEITIIL